ncbi:MAG: ACT domain-containing protein [Acidimicrobiales bacterium]
MCPGARRQLQGQIADADTRILTVAALKGVFARGSATPVSYVNAPLMAADRGVEVRESRSTTAVDYVSLLTIRGGHHSLAGTIVGLSGEQRLTRIDDNIVDIPPSLNMLYVRNDDKPGMIGRVGTILGEAGVNIDDMDVGRDPAGEPSTMVVATNRPIPPEVVERLRGTEGIVSVHVMQS